MVIVYICTEFTESIAVDSREVSVTDLQNRVAYL